MGFRGLIWVILNGMSGFGGHAFKFFSQAGRGECSVSGVLGCVDASIHSKTDTGYAPCLRYPARKFLG